MPSSTAMSSPQDMIILLLGPRGIFGWFGVKVHASQRSLKMKPMPYADASTNIFGKDKDKEEDCVACEDGSAVKLSEKVEEWRDRAEWLSQLSMMYTCAGVSFFRIVRAAFLKKDLTCLRAILLPGLRAVRINNDTWLILRLGSRAS